MYSDFDDTQTKYLNLINDMTKFSCNAIMERSEDPQIFLLSRRGRRQRAQNNTTAAGFVQVPSLNRGVTPTPDIPYLSRIATCIDIMLDVRTVLCHRHISEEKKMKCAPTKKKMK